MSFFSDVLIRLKDRNIIPTGFIDAGAHKGETYDIIKNIFPETKVISFEANPNNESFLAEKNKNYQICLLGYEDKEKMPFFINPNDVCSTGSSIYRETGHHFENAYTIDLPMKRLDSIIKIEDNFDFLKMDVQGAEIDILKGATKLLPSIKYIYLEVSFLECNTGAPLFAEVHIHLTVLGYKIIDISEPVWLHSRLHQCNFLFEKIT